MGADVALECCEDEAVLTGPGELEVETLPAAEATGPVPSSPSDTWFDPGAVLQELLGAAPAEGFGEERGDSRRGDRR
jgi:hypothetical protein